MSIQFDTTDDTMQKEMVRRVISQLNKPAELKTGGPMKEPPIVPQVTNPKRHRVAAWRHDGRGLDNTLHETKETALEYAHNLSWAVHYRYAVIDGRDTVESSSIDIPDGYAIDENFRPVRLDWQ